MILNNETHEVRCSNLYLDHMGQTHINTLVAVLR